MDNKLFYVQNPQTHVGNSMLWWKEGNCGYVCDIREARIFTENEIEKMHSVQNGEKIAWPKEYIDGLVQHHIDFQDCEKPNC